MASSIFQRTVVDEQGNIVTGAVVEVRNELTDELAPIFVDRPLAEVKANPFTTDSTGFIKFFVGRGEYRIKATFGDSEIVWRFVQMLDTDYLVNLDVEQTLENKTLIEPNIQTISNAGLLTLPAATDTLVGRATTDTLTNKTLTSPTINGGTITGITDLAVADGGTGRSTLTANNVLIGNGTSGVNFVAPGAAGNLLTSDGTTWISTTTPTGGAGDFTTLEYTETFTGGTGVVNLGSGQFVKDANGNVAIGTSSPATLLHVSGSYPTLKVENTNAAGNLIDVVHLDLTGEVRGSGVGNERSILFGKINEPGRQAKIAYQQNLSNGQFPSLGFFTGDSVSALVENMRIASNGQQLSVIAGQTQLRQEFKCRAFANVDAELGMSVRESGNISSITRTSTGVYTVTLQVAMPDANYAVTGTVDNNPNSANGRHFEVHSLTASSFQAITRRSNAANSFDNRDFFFQLVR